MLSGFQLTVNFFPKTIVADLIKQKHFRNDAATMNVHDELSFVATGLL